MQSGEHAVEVVPVEPRHAAALANLFERSGSHCYCRYFHFAGDKYDWQDRLGNRAHENRSELLTCLRQRDRQALGVVALEDGSLGPEFVVGWLKLTPAALMQKQYDQRPYRGLACFRRPTEGVYTVGCFLVDPARRHLGVARQLLSGVIRLATDLGARSLEAFPHRSPDGFELADDSVRAYPVLRKKLAG
jgi:GNAT superfamily N-acetyltransferase